jgi:hypothetical protein
VATANDADTNSKASSVSKPEILREDDGTIVGEPTSPDGQAWEEDTVLDAGATNGDGEVLSRSLG